MALAAFAVNAFNMLPLVPLDGGRAAAAITPWLWPLCIAGLAAHVWWKPGLFPVLVLAIGTVSAIVRLRKRNRSDYYACRGGRAWPCSAPTWARWERSSGGIVLAIAIGQKALKLVP